MSLEQEKGEGRELYNNLYRSLQHPEQRRILFSLLKVEPEPGLMVPEDIHVGETQLSRLDMELGNHHLPMLERAGLIRWERNDGRVFHGPNFATLMDLIKVISEYDPLVLERLNRDE